MPEQACGYKNYKETKPGTLRRPVLQLQLLATT
jgi:hypothetical protein